MQILTPVYPESPVDRRHDLDWVRVCAFGALVLYHVGMYYVSWEWHVKSPDAGPALEPFMLLTSPWRLSLLFLVSGAASAYLLGRRPQGFLKARSWRLLLPLIFGMLVIVPPQAYYELIGKAPAAASGGYLEFWARYLRGGDLHCVAPGDCIDAPSWNHLWFVVYLWAYTVVLWCLFACAPAVVGAMRAAAGRAFSGCGLLLWPAVMLAAARVALVGTFESTHDLVDDWYNHAQYFPLFLLGFLVARDDRVWDAMLRLRWAAAWTALAGYAFIAWYFHGSGHDELLPPPDWLRMLQRAAWGINQWCTIVAILGFARRLAPGDSRALRYLTPAVFPVYILHQTVLIVASQQLKPLGLTAWIEGPLLVLLTFALCFGGYEIVRRIAWLRPLFGLRPIAGGTEASKVAGMALR